MRIPFSEKTGLYNDDKDLDDHLEDQQRNIRGMEHPHITYSDVKKLLESVPYYNPKKNSLSFFERTRLSALLRPRKFFLTQSRYSNLAQNTNITSGDVLDEQEQGQLTNQQIRQQNARAQKELQIAVVSQVAETLWLNFTAKGKDSAMLRHLQKTLREQYGEELVFKYNKNAREVCIMLKVNKCFRSLTRRAQVNLIDRARQISQEVVTSYIQH